MSAKEISFAHGRIQGITESGWACGDCGNFYDAGVDHCPNRILDEARAALRKEQALARIHGDAEPVDSADSADEH
jgi:hypothetical protein